MRERGRERERENKQGRGRERERDRIPSRFCSASTEPNVGLELTNCDEIMTWAEVKSRMLDRLSHPGAPAALNLDIDLLK